MRRRAAVLLVLLLLPAWPAAGQDAHARYKQFFYDSVQFRWPKEEASEQRVVMLRNFERHDLPEAAEWIMTEVLAKDDAGDVLREAVRVLNTYKGPETLAEMRETWERKLRKPVEARVLGVLSFSKTQQDQGAALLEQALRDKDERVVLAGLAAIRESGRRAMKDEVAKFVSHKHPLLRAGALACLGELKAEEMQPDIFRLFAGDPSLRVRYDAWLALKRLALEELPCDPAAWKEWWERRAAAAGDGEGAWGPFPAPKEPTPASSFFGIPVLADRVCFVLDVSQDMDNPWTLDLKAERDKPKEQQIPNFFSVKTRWTLVANYVKACIAGLPDRTEVAFVFFNQSHAKFPENGRLLKLGGKGRDKVSAHLDEIVERSGSTAMFEALEAAWGFLREGDPDANFDKGCETIVFVTDGACSAGALAKRGDRLRDEVWKIAQTRGIRFHTVGLHNHDFTMCQGMAKASLGLYVHAQQSDDTAEPQDLDFWPLKKKAFEDARKKRKG